MMRKDDFDPPPHLFSLVILSMFAVTAWVMLDAPFDGLRATALQVARLLR